MNLVERVKGIILNPNAEWQVIERESGDAGYLFTNYVAILAAIPAVAGLIGNILIGMSFGFALFTAIIGYVLTFVFVYVVALIVDALAPSFGGRKDMASALKLTTYSYTPYWVAGILLIIPRLGILVSLLGLYSLYVLYLGLPTLMKSPKERSLVYAIVIVVCAIVVIFLVTVIIGLLFAGLFLS